jgi:hypothetical protein
MKTGHNSILTISLDFELFWGMEDKSDLNQYKQRLLGTRQAIPEILQLFKDYEIHATWATVGFLFFNSKDELIKNLPYKEPNYNNRRYNPYNHIGNIGNNEEEDPFHYALSLIEKIKSTPYQEIGTHTLTHFFCLEDGQDIESFSCDLEQAILIAKNKNLDIKSLVFPRNQVNEAYFSVCKEMGIKSYRGTENSWIYKPRKREDESRIRRLVRLIDSYINISGHHTYHLDELQQTRPFNLRSSRFHRAYSRKLRFFEPLKLRRIVSDLTYAAHHQRVYHIWWHPHNFSVNIEQNILVLKKILIYFSSLRDKFHMESLNMGEVAEILEEKRQTKDTD